MDEIEWVKLTEVVGTVEADMIFYDGYGIQLATFEGANTQDVIPVTFGRVQVYVEKKDVERARALLEEYEEETQ